MSSSAEGQQPEPYQAVMPPGSVPPSPYAPSPSYGPPSAGPGYQTSYPAVPGTPQPPRRGMKGWQVAAVAATTGVIGLVAGIGIGSAGEDPAPAAESTTIARTQEPTSADEAAGDEPTDPATQEAPVDDEQGTRGAPYPVGTPVTDGEWDVTLGAPREAWAEIQAENQFNDPPAEGMAYYLVPVTATYVGDETGLPWMDLSVKFVGSDARTYTDSCGVIPADLMDVDELYEGGTAEGNVCVTVPAGADGLWTLSTGWGGSTVFFTADG